QAEAGTEVELIAAETPFYGEAGGQVGDRGEITGPSGRLEVSSTLRLPGDLLVHVGRVVEGKFAVGDPVRLKVDEVLRQDTQLNHTATHILHAVLRKVLGDHVKQSGSLVSSDRLRFDFTHFSGLSQEEFSEIERLVNNEIRRNHDLRVHVMDLDEALKTGAMALFEEKYGDRVRLIEIPGFSRELCGGTHTHRTGDIGLFVLLQETSVAAGVRRIEALTGRHALNYLRRQQGILQQVAGLLKSSPSEVVERVEKLLAQQKEHERELEAIKASLTTKRSADLLEQAEEVAGTRLLIAQVDADSPKTLREMNDQFKGRLQSGVIVLGAAKEGKVFLLVGVTPDLAGRVHAGQVIGQIAREVGGSGGGRPDMAQAGGTRPEKLADALKLARKLVEQRLR
ncbi:MAG TPA: DHHA1 domain-containing protein, partial [Syntrophobacteraceae bacterium]|nr:DHHA1 domain-containing protein [Syntrophobacteraceae bacterium]